MDKKFLEELRQKLEEKKESLEKQLASFAKKDKNVKGDWDTKFPEYNDGQLEEAASEVEEYSTNLPIEFSLETRLRDINSALEKIKKGKYGICERCGKKISEERLKAFPEARFCLKCEKK
jgi:DnaK suppressor protein